MQEFCDVISTLAKSYQLDRHSDYCVILQSQIHDLGQNLSVIRLTIMTHSEVCCKGSGRLLDGVDRPRVSATGNSSFGDVT